MMIMAGRTEVEWLWIVFTTSFHCRSNATTHHYDYFYYEHSHRATFVPSCTWKWATYSFGITSATAEYRQKFAFDSNRWPRTRRNIHLRLRLMLILQNSYFVHGDRHQNRISSHFRFHFIVFYDVVARRTHKRQSGWSRQPGQHDTPHTSRNTNTFYFWFYLFVFFFFLLYFAGTETHFSITYLSFVYSHVRRTVGCGHRWSVLWPCAKCVMLWKSNFQI